MQLRRFLLVLSITAAALAPSSAALGQAVEHPHGITNPVISGRDATIAGLILAAAMMGDEGLQEEFQEHRTGGTNSVARLGNSFGDPLYVIPAIGVGYLAGRLTGDHAVSHVALRVGKAALLSSGITTALKYSIGRTRPTHGGDSDQFRPFGGATSFPSGHTTLAFAVATVVADATTDSWSDVALYGAATMTAFARVNDDRHWTSDVLAGALVGHLSARWLDRRSTSLMVSPRAVGLSLTF
jgi:membrane-associated phospholipid phosphatase